MALIGEMKYLTIGENTYSISAGAKTFIVTLTESNGTYTSDKTAEEIYTAFNAGDTVLLDCGSYVLLSSVYEEDDYYQANFYKSEASTGSFHEYQYIIVTDNGTTSVEYTDYETPVNNGSLVIQKNGSTVGTFSANSSSNITANITVPTKVSDLTNDSGYITTYTETDPTVPAWAKQSTKPTYVAAEVGALPDTTQIPSKTSDLVNDSGFIAGYTETDPTVPAWAKQSTKPSYTANEVGALPASTVIPSATSDLTNDSGFITTNDIPVSDVEVDGVSVVSNGTAEIDLTGKLDTTYNNSSIEWRTFPAEDALMIEVGSSDKAGFSSVTAKAAYLGYRDYTNSAKSHNISITPDAGMQITTAGKTISVPTTKSGTLALIGDIPTATSDLTNDSGFITVNDVPEEVFIASVDSTTYTDILAAANDGKIIMLVDDGVLLPCSVSVNTNNVSFRNFNNGFETTYIVTATGWTSTNAGFARTANLATVATSGSYNDLSNRPTVSNVQIVRWSEENN